MIICRRQCRRIDARFRSYIFAARIASDSGPTCSTSFRKLILFFLVLLLVLVHENIAGSECTAISPLNFTKLYQFLKLC